jgi:CTP:molybdopterin cytidylyltransferase MocA
VVLAAGASTRLGEPKQLVLLGGETLLERAVRTCVEAGLKPVIVVLGANATQVAARCDLRAAEVVRCERWAEGMGQSIAVGIGAAQEAGARSAVVLTADMPFVSAEHLAMLSRKREDVRASNYAGRNGVPAHFPQSMFGELMSLHGDAGARALLSEATCVPLSAEQALDVDTKDDLVKVRAQFAVAKRPKKGSR